MSALPRSIDYTEPIPTLPDNTASYQMVSTAVNGSSFQPSSIIQVDLVKRGFLVSDSVYLRYKVAYTGTTTACQMIGTPVYTPINRLELFAGTTQLESIQNYNQVANCLVNWTQSVDSKYGLQSAYGYGGQTTADPAMSKMDGKIFTSATSETYSVSAPLPCMLTNCEKMIPLFAMPQIRFQFTLDSLANMFAVVGTSPVLTISNFELCYTIVDMGTEVENMVMSLPKFYLKTQSFSNTAQNIASGTLGSQTFPFNINYASIKGLYTNFSGTSANSVNKWGDSYDVTQSNGDMVYNIGGINYPQRPLSTLLNKASFLQELRKAIGSIYSSTNTLSINSIEFYREGDVATTSSEPAKFWFAVSTEKLHNGGLLTGVSSNGSAILLTVNLNTATAAAYNINLIVNYDALIEIDTQNFQVSVKK